MTSIVIVTWNTRDLLRACLASIESSKCCEGAETIVVDNASADSTAEMIRSEYPWVRLIANSSNIGYAAGNNQGFEAAAGDYVLTLNPDTELNKDSLSTPEGILDADPRVACVAVKLVGAQGMVQRSIRGFPSLTGIIGDLLRIRSGSFDSYRLTHFDYEKEQDAPQPMGTYLLLRRSALDEIGVASAPFDPAFPIFFNEVDLLYRLRKAGYRCVYTPRAKILHHGGESTKQVRPQMIWESHRSLVRYLLKHTDGSGRRIVVILAAPLIYAAALLRAKRYHAGFRA